MIIIYISIHIYPIDLQVTRNPHPEISSDPGAFFGALFAGAGRFAGQTPHCNAADQWIFVGSFTSPTSPGSKMFQGSNFPKIEELSMGFYHLTFVKHSDCDHQKMVSKHGFFQPHSDYVL